MNVSCKILRSEGIVESNLSIKLKNTNFETFVRKNFMVFLLYIYLHSMF